jgi:predicted lipid-binding transport protein (Tim44 family)
MMTKRHRLTQVVTVLFLLMFLVWTFPLEALARGGRGMSGGSSMGSKGSRSSTPVRPYAPPSATTPKPTTPGPGTMRPTPSPLATSPTASPTGGFWRNVGGGMLGGLAGGMLASWLFSGSSSAQAKTGSGSEGYKGPGLMDILILAGIGFLIYYLIRRRRENQVATQEAYQTSAAGVNVQPPYYDQAPPVQSEGERDLEKGLSHIQQLDPLFNEDRFRDQVMDNFFKIQGAWSDRDMSSVKHLLTEEMYRILQEDAAKMRADGMINKLENIAVREVNLTEAWQESGQDFITVRIYANMLDYSVEEKNGEVVSGSKSDPVKFEEYWTLNRAVGNNPWQLTAINQAA